VDRSLIEINVSKAAHGVFWRHQADRRIDDAKRSGGCQPVDPAEEITPMPKPVLTLAATWATFDGLAFDDTVTNAEKVAARRVFYAGAQSVLDILLAGLEPTIEATEREVDRIEALSEELRRFAEEAEAGRA
jgi:hypothetical protein